MTVTVHFYSYFSDLTKCGESVQDLPPEATIEELLNGVFARFPQLKPMQKSMLIAVGVDYQPRSYRLQPGDKVSLFPPVQGG